MRIDTHEFTRTCTRTRTHTHAPTHRPMFEVLRTLDGLRGAILPTSTRKIQEVGLLGCC